MEEDELVKGWYYSKTTNMELLKRQLIVSSNLATDDYNRHVLRKLTNVHHHVLDGRISSGDLGNVNSSYVKSPHEKHLDDFTNRLLYIIRKNYIIKGYRELILPRIETIKPTRFVLPNEISIIADSMGANGRVINHYITIGEEKYVIDTKRSVYEVMGK